MRRLLPIVMLAFAAASCDGCDDDALDTSHLDAGRMPGGLTPEQAKQVVAKVGDRTITLGDYAAALERMNEYDRLRYQTKERRRELLQELIDLELLADEARRRGLADEPEVQEEVRRILREAMLNEAYRALPNPGEFTDAQVKAYYEAHESAFTEPERRRVSAIVTKDRETAEKVLEKVREGDGETWGKLFSEHSITKPEKPDPDDPADLAGDLGFVGPPGDVGTSNGKIPAAVRKALFTLSAVGDVYDGVVEADGKFYVLRFSGLSQGRKQPLEDVATRIRSKLFDQKKLEIEQQLEADLRKRYKVEVDEAALKGVKVPEGATDYEPQWDDRAPEGGGGGQ